MLAQIEPAPNFYPIITTDGITIAIVSFLFACFVFPKTVKHRPQFYAAFFITIAIILLATLRLMLYQSGLYVVFGVLTGIAQVAAIVMLFLASGGMSIGEFTEEVKESYEVIRRGETEKEVIVPLRGEQPRARRDVADAPANVHVIETPRTKPDRSGPMPLE